MTDKNIPPHAFIRELDNILSVTTYRNGDKPPVVLWRVAGHTVKVEVTLEDVTDDPFYNDQGLIERLEKKSADS